MRRVVKLAMLGLAAGFTTACDPETVVKTEDIPTAGVRFIHAVPDTAAMDMRFIDMVENNAHFAIAYRANVVTANASPVSTFVSYKPTRAGSRHFRIFMNGNCGTTSCDQSYASTVVKDTTVDLVAGRNYTALLIGYANPTGPSRPAGAPTMRLVFQEENVPDPGTQVALRVINATEQAIDVRYYPDGGTAPATATWAAIPAASISSYITAAPGNYFYNVRAAGAGTNLVATDARALLGAAATTVAPGPFDAIPGTSVAGSAVTGIVFPRSVAGSQAPNVTTPSISFVWDRRPPRPAGI